jgi:hypothetical protein
MCVHGRSGTVALQKWPAAEAVCKTTLTHASTATWCAFFEHATCVSIDNHLSLVIVLQIDDSL